MSYKTYSNTGRQPSIAWLQITAGQGPKECGWVVAQLEKIIVGDAAQQAIRIERIESLAFDKHLRYQDVEIPDAYLSILLRLEGKGVERFARQWHGTVQWKGQSPYREKHKRVNWFVGVAELLLPANNASVLGRDSLQGEKLDSVLSEVTFESMRSKGPGGQHVNKTNSAVRLTHRPTGLQIRVDSDRSQHRNKQLAVERLLLVLNQQQQSQQQSVERLRWMQHYEVKRGSPIRCFYGEKFTD